MNNIEYLIQMGKRIRAIRNAKKLTLRELGKLCNLDYGTLSRIENGNYNSYLLTLKKIADTLEVDVKDFL